MGHETVRLDVRQAIRDGAEPCSRIMKQAKRLRVGATLELITPFEPTPLYDVLGREGFTHEAHPLADGDWEVRFTRNLKASSGARDPGEGRCEGDVPRTIEVDVRGLEPPQLMARILDAVAALPEGTRLCARTDRQPVLLCDQLKSRGFHGECSEDSHGGHVTVICRR